jgi:hypothetical protein
MCHYMAHLLFGRRHQPELVALDTHAELIVQKLAARPEQTQAKAHEVVALERLVLAVEVAGPELAGGVGEGAPVNTTNTTRVSSGAGRCQPHSRPAPQPPASSAAHSSVFKVSGPAGPG